MNPNGYSIEEIETMKENQFDSDVKSEAKYIIRVLTSKKDEPSLRDVAFIERVLRRWWGMGRNSVLENQPADIEADGVVFCGRCGHQK